MGRGGVYLPPIAVGAHRFPMGVTTHHSHALWRYRLQAPLSHCGRVRKLSHALWPVAGGNLGALARHIVQWWVERAHTSSFYTGPLSGNCAARSLMRHMLQQFSQYLHLHEFQKVKVFWKAKTLTFKSCVRAKSSFDRYNGEIQ